MRKISEEDFSRAFKASRTSGGMSIVSFIMAAVGVGLIIAGFFDDGTALTDDGYSRRTFLFVFGGIWAVIWGACGLMISAVRLVEKKEYQTMREHGRYGQAAILKSDEAGSSSKRSRVDVKLRLEVRLEELAPYEIEEIFTVPVIKLPQIQPGATVEVIGVTAISGVRLGVVKLLYK